MPRNIVLITFDALRADHLSCYGYERETSPFLASVAADGARFDRAFSASSHTREAVPSILTGRYPDDAVDAGYQRDADTVAARLASNGFETAGFHSNPFVSRAYGFDQGFDHFDDDLHLGKNRLLALAQRALDKVRNRHYARASEINERSLEWLDSLDGGPFFLWNHYMDPHGPYEAPAAYQREFHGEAVPDSAAQDLYQRAISDPESITDAERERLMDLYDAEINYTDDRLRSLFDGLEERGLLSESLVLLTADHGDAFGEHGYFEHPRYLHDELVHVPLVMAGPDVPSATIETPASTLDVARTALETAGTPVTGLPGEDLRAVVDSPEAYADRVVVSQARGEDGDAHLRRFSARSESATWFGEYDTTADDLSLSGGDAEGETAAQLRGHVAERTDAEGTTQASETEAVDDEIEDRLSALGYK
ncbi:sulfatase [Halosimplex litoreum]|uniref:Sulfatase n=1 Tax=Halosimplex litoreum TaxID=1198301 RepID=A0A7T3G111_9EURY|nr:sulfatase [Halosimplex litoreum]QPV64351.1 sulfatase [Halosimplex litoreum]